MINELSNSWERRSHCENNFGNAVPRRSCWKRSLPIVELVASVCHPLQSIKVDVDVVLGQVLIAPIYNKLKLKPNKALSENSSLTFTLKYLPCGITLCYLPPDTSERALS